MRKFKFIGGKDRALEYGDEYPPEFRKVYNENDIVGTYTVIHHATASERRTMDEWQEVFEVNPTFSVTNPDHYKAGEIECWDAIEAATIGKTGAEAYYVGNIIKYLWRYDRKGGLTDIEKAKVYIDKLIELKQ